MTADFEQGVTHLRAGRFGRAAEIFAALVIADPEDNLARLRLGEALVRTKQFNYARGHLAECLNRDPQNPQALYFMAVAVMGLGRRKRAIMYFNLATEAAPDWYIPHYQLGLLHERDDNLEDAIFHLSQCCQLRPDFDQAVDELATLLIKNNRAADAIPFLESLLEQIPDHKRANQLLHRAKLIHRSLDPDQPVMVPPAFQPRHDESPVRGDDLFFSIALHARAVQALLLREIRTKFGRHQMGLLWALLEPVMFVVIMDVAFSTIGRRVPQGMTLELMLVSGYVPWTMFSNTRMVVAKAVTTNKPLLFYPGVVPIDLVATRALLEYLIGATVMIIMFLALGLAGQDITIGAPVNVIAMYTLLWLGGVGLGLASGPLALRYPSVENILAVVMRLVFITSGIFFLARDIPADMRYYAMFNPIMNAIDLLRDGLFAGYRSDGGSWSYCIVTVFGMLFFGLLVDRAILRPLMFKR